MGTNILKWMCILLITSVYSEEDLPRNPRFSIFQIIKFENGPCTGATRPGTCFTESECKAAGGEKDGSCADGFGVCCTVVLKEGTSTALNQSAIVQAASAALNAGSMQYTICPCSTDVCRIRFDFTQFILAAPNTGLGTGVAAPAATTGVSTGDCIIDQFSITSPSSSGSPVICGVNDGQHMIIDSNGSGCSKVNFGIGGANVNRQWDIRITQFKCGDEMGGPSGCLQWFTTGDGTIRSFNFPTQADGAAVADNVVHLSNQFYSVCIRKPADATIICYSPCTQKTVAQAANANMGSSFGVSVAPAAAGANANSGVGSTTCLTDYIEIPGGDTQANAGNGAASFNNRYCGRELGPADNANADNVASVCSASVPFQLNVHFDADEASGATMMAKAEEDFGRPGGITGFSLCYTTP